MRNSVGLVVAAALLALGACGGDEPREGGVTAEESKQLNEAAEMLDASPDGLVAGDETGLGNGEAGSAEAAEAAAGNEAAANAAANSE
jgi:hypothetical protein